MWKVKLLRAKFIIFFIVLIGGQIINIAKAQSFLAKVDHPVTQSTVLNDKLLFVTRELSSKVYLWISDGTQEGTHVLKEFDTEFHDDEPRQFTLYNEKLYFLAYDKLNGNGIWATDGTSKGTSRLSFDHVECSERGALPGRLRVFNNYLYFHEGRDCAKGVWRTDGVNLERVTPEGLYDNPREIYTAGDLLFLTFLWGYPNTVYTLKADGGNQINQFLPDIKKYTHFEALNETVIFATPDTTQQQILQRYNVNTAQIDTIGTFQRESQFDNFTQNGDQLFFSVRNINDYDHTDQLYTYSISKKNAIMLHEFEWRYHSSESYIQQFTIFKGNLYFRSGEADNHFLWTSDGTKNGTYKVSDSNISDNAPLTVSSNKLYFGASVNYSYKLLESDGTNAGTKLSSILTLYQSDKINHLNDVNGTLFYFGDDGYGNSLWKNSEAPKLNFLVKGRELINKSLTNFPVSKVDSLVSLDLKITNIGKAPLAISNMEIIGKSFYLSDTIPNIIYPNDEVLFKLFYFPSVEGEEEGRLILHTNDLSQNRFEFGFQAKAVGKINANTPDSISLPIDKSINFDNDLPILLSNNIIYENTPSGTIVGQFFNDSTQNNYNITFSENDSVGTDNEFFKIEGTTLMSNSSFDYEKKSTYHISIEATNTQSQKSVKQHFTIAINDISEAPILQACGNNEYPLSYALKGIDQIDQEEYLAVGEYGTIIKTEDSGKHWRKIEIPYKGHLQRVQMINNYGYAMSNSHLLKTEDAGESWFLLNITSSLKALYFLNADKGFLVGERSMFMTSDGGKSWNESYIGWDSFADIYFRDDSIGFVCGGKKLLRTSDGGNTWENIGLDLPIGYASFVEIEFVDESFGFLVASDGSFFRTEDGGESWTLVSNVSLSTKGIHFTDNQNGYIFGNNVGSNVFQTRDGGANWEKVEVYSENSVGLFSILDMSFNKELNQGVMVGRASITYGSEESGRVLVHYNEQNEWEITSYHNDSKLDKISFLNDQLGFVIGEGIYQTEDGGIHWLPINLPQTEITSDIYWRGGHFYDAEHFIIIGPHNAYRTMDGGNSWEVILQSNSWLTELHFVNEQKGFISASNGSIFQTNDGGKSWIQADLGQYSSIRDIHFLNEMVGYCVSSGKIFKTKNGGQTWSSYTYNEETIINALHFFDENNAVLGTFDGIVYYTNDGGANWYKGKSESKVRILKLQMVSSEIGYACNGNRELLVTRDGGKTWFKEYQLTNSVNSFFINNDNIYLVGTYNYISKIKSSVTSLQPGYIYGPTQVTLGEKAFYSIKMPQLDTYQWNISGDNEISFRNEEAIVEWKQVGEHTIEVQSIDGCGVSTLREFSVTVNSTFQPKILGIDSVAEFEKNVSYILEERNDNEKIWMIQGHADYRLSNDTLWVDWGDAGQGIIEVVETDRLSQTRSKASLKVIIGIDDDYLTSVESELNEQSLRVYPNPAYDFVNIKFPESNIYSKVKIQVMDINGTTYFRDRLFYNNHDMLILNMQEWPIGIYIIKFEMPDGTVKFQKIIKY